MTESPVASVGVLSLRTPVGARLRLCAAGGPPLRATPTQFTCWDRSWPGRRGGAEGWPSAAQTEGSTAEVRSDRTPQPGRERADPR